MKDKVKKLPTHLYRHDDGARFTRQLFDGLYTMDSSMMRPKYRYSYDRLIKDGFVSKLSDCEITTYKSHNDGHGDEDDESC